MPDCQLPKDSSPKANRERLNAGKNKSSDMPDSELPAYPNFVYRNPPLIIVEERITAFSDLQRILLLFSPSRVLLQIRVEQQDVLRKRIQETFVIG